MTYKYLTLFILTCTQVISSTSSVKLSAKKFMQQENTTTATGDILFKSDNYEIESDKIVYDKNKTVLEFFKKIKINDKQNDISIKAQYLKTILKNDYLYMKNSLLIDKKNNIWIKSKCSEKENNIYKLTDTIISSCSNQKNPFWKIKFKEGSYNAKQETLSLSNALMYVQSIPIAYTPYIELPIGDRQKSGLLMPQFSLFQNKAYMQPVFFNIQDNIDLEITPFLREEQGSGIYAKLRFIDSNSSQGSFSLGTFKSSSDSILKEKEFNGVEFMYANKNTDKKNKTSMFISDIKFFDHSSYLKFKTLDTIALKIDSISSSKIAYIQKNTNWNIDTQIKNIKDVKKNTSIQLLPLIKIDKVRSFIGDKLSYKFNYRFEYRNVTDGLNPLYQEAVMPHFYNVSVFNEFVDIEVKNELKLTMQDFFKNDTSIQSEQSVQDYLNISIASKLAKKYENIVHNIDFNIYNKTLLKDFRSGGFILPDGDKDKIGIEVKQYFSKNGKNFLSHSISQEVYTDETQKNFNLLGSTVSYFKYRNKNINIYNKSSYSIQDKMLSYLSTAIEIKSDFGDIAVSHLFEDQKIKNKIKNYIGANIKSKVSKNIKIKLGVEIDQVSKQVKKWESSVEYTKDCWGYMVKVGKSHIPYSYQASTDTTNNHLVYFQVRLNPIGAISHGYYF